MDVFRYKQLLLGICLFPYILYKINDTFFSPFQISFFRQILLMILRRLVGVTPDLHSNMLATQKQGISFPKVYLNI